MFTIDDVRGFISSFLIRCNVLPDKAGFDYIIEGALLFMDYKGEKLRICRDVYVPVACKFMVNQFCVERNIRYALSKLDREEFSLLTGEPKNKAPTVKKFLAATAKFVSSTLKI